MKHTLILALLFPLLTGIDGQAEKPPTGTWLDSFSVVGPASDRYKPAWQDIPKGIGRYYSPDDGWRRYKSFIADQFTEGTIEVTTGMVKPIVLNQDNPQFASTGLVIKSTDEEWLTLRVGAYGQIILEGITGGQPFPKVTKPFTLEAGRSYRLKVEFGSGRIKVWVDGQLYFDEACALTTEPGDTGLYCESPVWFDEYRVTGVVNRQLMIKPLTGTPQLDTVYARFRADLPAKHEIISTHGSIDLYLHNSGDGPARLKAIDLNGKPIDYSSQSTPVTWYEQRPWQIEPGETGLVILRIRGLPEAMGATLMDNPSARPPFNLTAHWEGGVSKSFEVPFQGEVEPFQINFLGFSEDLKTLWIYVQNNDWVYRDGDQPATINKVWVGGKDVTQQARIGVKAVRGHPVPIAVDFEEPLPLRRHVSVVVESDHGRAGHTLRAIPSRTLMQVCVFAEWTGTEVVTTPREDWIEDLDNHCVNAMSVVGKKYDHLPRVKELGMYAGAFGSFVSGYGGWGNLWRKPGNPKIVSCWMDEVDKKTPFELFEAYQAMFRSQREKGLRPPFHSSNIMVVHSPGAMGYLEMNDGVIHAYGLAEKYGVDFGRFSSLPYREHRMARRPFHPYLRNAEVYGKYIPEEKMVSELSDQYRRCMTPDEERWQYYGLLLQGAKGVQHWGYSNIHDTGYGGDYRLGLGGAGTGRTWEYPIHPRIVKMLQDTWDEIGRLNAEWLAIEHLIGISDVSDHARITSCDPALNREGKPAVAASSLLAGLDAMVVVVVNHHFDMFRTNTEKTSVFHPVNVVTDVTLPPWLTPVDVFRVSHDGLTDIETEKPDKTTLRISETVRINDLIVITGKKGMKEEVAAKLANLNEKLQRAYTAVPVHTTRANPFLKKE